MDKSVLVMPEELPNGAFNCRIHASQVHIFQLIQVIQRHNSLLAYANNLSTRAVHYCWASYL
jgi:hypothetical protein